MMAPNGHGELHEGPAGALAYAVGCQVRCRCRHRGAVRPGRLPQLLDSICGNLPDGDAGWVVVPLPAAEQAM
jgi:hypothetical protein